jgi:hypothetical protein
MSQVAKNVKRYGRDDRPGDHARSGILSRAEPQQHRWLPPRLPAGTDTVHRGAFEVLGQDNRDAYIGVGMADALMAAVPRAGDHSAFTDRGLSRGSVLSLVEK